MVGTSEVPPCGRLFFLLRLISGLSLVFAVDLSLEDLRGLEDQDPALLNGYLDASLRVEPDALDLAAHAECAEAGEFHSLAPDKCVANLAEHLAYKFCGLRSRETNLLVDGFAQILSPDGPASHWSHPLLLVQPTPERELVEIGFSQR